MINCLARAIREFIDVGAYFPRECAMVIKNFSSGYKHDKKAKEQKFPDEEKLLYRQRTENRLWINGSCSPEYS